MYVETLEVAGIFPAIIGMRNPMNSWERSDSGIEHKDDYGLGALLGESNAYIGEKDLELARKLIRGGPEHRKFMRQIQVWADVRMPRYIWQELDTYSFGSKNSCSTMHTIMRNKLTLADFYIGEDPIIMTERVMSERILPDLNYFRKLYLESKDYRWVKEMKRILPESYLQIRTWNTNYEEIRNVYHQRMHHRLDEEWGVILEWIESLPYFEELILCD